MCSTLLFAIRDDDPIGCTWLHRASPPYSQLLVNERSLALALDARHLSLQGESPLSGVGSDVEETAVGCIAGFSCVDDPARLLDAAALLFILGASLAMTE